MKALKIDLSMYECKVRELVSEAVQKKAFGLGYAWPSSGTKINNTPFTWLFLSSSGLIEWGVVDVDYPAEGHIISASDFLALITAKDAPMFAPFDKVLVRDEDGDVWRCNFFSHIDDIGRYKCVYSLWKQCIIYEGNEHLFGTTDEPKS